jgi:hypothetical protein
VRRREFLRSILAAAAASSLQRRVGPEVGTQVYDVSLVLSPGWHLSKASCYIPAAVTARYRLYVADEASDRTRGNGPGNGG